MIWTITLMIDHRRAPRRGRPSPKHIPQRTQCAVEFVLAVGAVVCFIFMVVILYNRGDDVMGDGGAVPLNYNQSLGWFLGMLM